MSLAVCWMTSASPLVGAANLFSSPLHSDLLYSPLSLLPNLLPGCAVTARK